MVVDAMGRHAAHSRDTTGSRIAGYARSSPAFHRHAGYHRPPKSGDLADEQVVGN
jgi:hypothetical protein